MTVLGKEEQALKHPVTPHPQELDIQLPPLGQPNQEHQSGVCGDLLTVAGSGLSLWLELGGWAGWAVGQQTGPQATAKLECLAKVYAIYQENEESGDLRRTK